MAGLAVVKTAGIPSGVAMQATSRSRANTGGDPVSNPRWAACDARPTRWSRASGGPRAWIRLATVALLLQAALADPLPAQIPVSGVVRDSAGRPLGGSDVTVDGAPATDTSDGLGRYRLSLPLGRHLVRFRRIGYEPVVYAITLVDSAGVALDVTLRPAPQVLPDIAVPGAPTDRWMPGFARRRAEGFGQFLDDSLMRRSEHRRLPDVIRTHATGIRFQRIGNRLVALGMRSTCPMAVWLDGLRLYAPDTRSAGAIIKRLPSPNDPNPPPDFAQWSVTDIQGVEIYASAGQTPAQFQLTGSSCGTILLWTRIR